MKTILPLLAFCSLAAAQVTTTGFSNAARTEAPGTLLSHPVTNGSEPIGRTTSINYLNGWIIVGAEVPGSRPGSDLQMRVYDIANPSNPVRHVYSGAVCHLIDRGAWGKRSLGKMSIGKRSCSDWGRFAAAKAGVFMLERLEFWRSKGKTDWSPQSAFKLLIAIIPNSLAWRKSPLPVILPSQKTPLDAL